MLEVLAGNLKLFEFVKEVQPILTAQVPVIKQIIESSKKFESYEKNEN